MLHAFITQLVDIDLTLFTGYQLYVFFQVCLFNVTADPCELNNLVFTYPDVVRIMERTIEMYRATAIPPGNKPIDPRGDPKLYGYTWTNWLDFCEPMDAKEAENMVKKSKLPPHFNDAFILSSLLGHKDILNLNI